MGIRGLKTTVISEVASLRWIAREQEELNQGLLGLVEGKEYGMYSRQQEFVPIRLEINIYIKWKSFHKSSFLNKKTIKTLSGA